MHADGNEASYVKPGPTEGPALPTPLAITSNEANLQNPESDSAERKKSQTEKENENRSQTSKSSSSSPPYYNETKESIKAATHSLHSRRLHSSNANANHHQHHGSSHSTAYQPHRAHHRIKSNPSKRRKWIETEKIVERKQNETWQNRSVTRDELAEAKYRMQEHDDEDGLIVEQHEIGSGLAEESHQSALPHEPHTKREERDFYYNAVLRNGFDPEAIIAHGDLDQMRAMCNALIEECQRAAAAHRLGLFQPHRVRHAQGSIVKRLRGCLNLRSRACL